MHDLIERQAVKEWLTRWEGYIDTDIIARMQYRVVDIPSARILQLTCNPLTTDSIDRQEAIKAVSEACFELRGVFKECEDRLLALPSTQPQRKNAYLIDPNPYGKCSNCGQLIDIRDEYNYCPNCGARMENKQCKEM